MIGDGAPAREEVAGREPGARTETRLRRAIRFGVVGLSGTLVNTVVLYLLVDRLGLNHLAAAVVATEVAILSNFLLNDRWTFRGVGPARPWHEWALAYNSVALVGLLVSVSVLAGLTYVGGLHYLVANLVAIGAATAWNFAGSSLVAWAPSRAGRDEVGTALLVRRAESEGGEA